MGVSLLWKGGTYKVQSESGSVYGVDVASETRICPGFSRRDPSDGHKHLWRTDLEIWSRDVPRPNGRLPEAMDIVERLSTGIRELE